jgi:hypothetical protein
MIAGASFEQALSWDVLPSPLPIASPRFGADETTMLRWGTLNPSGSTFGPGRWGYRHTQTTGRFTLGGLDARPPGCDAPALAGTSAHAVRDFRAVHDSAPEARVRE